MKIYFCGSIRGGRDDAALYAALIQQLKAHGRVLTEHIGNPEAVQRGKEGSDRKIWEKDTAWLRESDLVVAECTQPSLGVGYELAYAESLGKPVHILYRGEAKGLSAMIAGDPYFTVHLYRGAEDFPLLLSRIFPDGK